MGGKTEVYSWRVSSTTKSRLEDVARRERRTVAELLDEIVTGHLSAHEQQTVADADRQRDLHGRAARFAGCLSGADPHRSAHASRLVRARLAGRRQRAR